MRTAICPGSFDPITLGHLNIIRRTADIFDEVVVCVMKNASKTSPMFSVEERADMVRRVVANYPNVRVETPDGLLAEYAKQFDRATVVKGLRAASDFDYEFQQALTNKSLLPEIETVFLTAKGKNMFLSSSMVKEVCRLDGDISRFVPQEILEDVIKRCKGEIKND